MKPLEPGCLAIVITSTGENVGKVVTCVEYLGDMPEGFYSAGQYFGEQKAAWRIHPPIPTYFYDSRPSGRYTDYVAGYRLMRIDGDVDQKTEEAKRPVAVTTEDRE